MNLLNDAIDNFTIYHIDDYFEIVLLSGWQTVRGNPFLTNKFDSAKKKSINFIKPHNPIIEYYIINISAGSLIS